MSVVRAKRSLGQNFLVDPNLQRKIAAAIEPTRNDLVLEIGPGLGALTRHLAGQVKRLIAIEKDDVLAAQLQNEFANATDVQIVHGDALQTDLTALADTPEDLKVIGNIPFNITTPLLFHLLAPQQRPQLLVIMVQREVADRLLAPPGEKTYGALSVGVRSVASVERLFHVPRGAFRPAPKVDSTVLRIVPLRPAPLTPDEEQDLRTLTRVAFGWRRKQLQRTLRTAPDYGLGDLETSEVLRIAAVDPQERPEALSPDRFIALARALRARALPDRRRTSNVQS
jgi:16S rRNA (adenine1518-N6/adenine1519-N6)-dimethyltransferase